MKRKMLLHFRGLLLLPLLVLAVGCQTDKPLSPQARQFKQAVGQQLELLAKGVADGLARSDNLAIDATLTAYFAQTPWAALPCPYSVHVVDSGYNYLLGRHHSASSEISQVEKGRANYNHFQKIFRHLQNGQIVPMRFYDLDGPYIVICAPLFHGSDFMGAVGFLFATNCIFERYGLAQDQVLAIDFN